MGTPNSCMSTPLITTTHHSFPSLSVTPTSTFLTVTRPMSATLTNGNTTMPLTANITATPIRHSNISGKQTISLTTFSMSSVTFNSSSNQLMNSSKNVFVSQTATTFEKTFSIATTTTKVSSILSLISTRNNSKRITTPNTTFIIPTTINKVPNSAVVLSKTATIQSTSLTISNPSLKTSSMNTQMHNRPSFTPTSASNKSITSTILPKSTASHTSNTFTTTTSNTWTNKSTHNILLSTPSVKKLISSHLNDTETKNMATQFFATVSSTFNFSTQSSKTKMKFSSLDHSSTTVRKTITVTKSFVNSTPLNSFTVTSIAPTTSSTIYNSYLTSSTILHKSLTALMNSSKIVLVSNTATAAVSNTTISSLILGVTATASSTTTMAASNSSVVSLKTLTVHNTSITVSNTIVKTSSMITALHSRPNFTATFGSNKFVTSTLLPKTTTSFPRSIFSTPIINPWANKSAHSTTLPTPSLTRLISEYFSNTETESRPTIFLTTMTDSTLSEISNATTTLIRQLSTPTRRSLSVMTPNTTNSTWYTNLSLSTMITVTPSNYSNITPTATNSTFTPPQGTSSTFSNSPKSSNIEKNVSSLNSSSSTTIRKTLSFTKTLVVNLTSLNNFTATSKSPDTFSTIYNPHLISSKIFNGSLTAVMNSSKIVLASITATATVSSASFSSLRMTAAVSSTPNFTITSTRDNSTSMVTRNSTFILQTMVTTTQNTVLADSSNFTPTQHTFSKTISMSTTAIMVSNSSIVSSKTLTVYNTSITVSNVSVKAPSMTTPLHSLPSFTATQVSNISITSTVFPETMTSYPSNISAKPTSNLQKNTTSLPNLTKNTTIPSYQNYTGIKSMATTLLNTVTGTISLEPSNSTTTPIRTFSTFRITPNTTLRYTDSPSSTMIAFTASSHSSISAMPTSGFQATTKLNITTLTYMNSPMLSNTMMNSSLLNYANSTVKKTIVTSAVETNSVALSTYILTSLTSSKSTALYVTSTTERIDNSQTVKSLISSAIQPNESTPSVSRTSNTQLLNSSRTTVMESSSTKKETSNISVVTQTLLIPSPTLSTRLLTIAVSSTTLSVTTSVVSLKHFSPNSYWVTSSANFTDSSERTSAASAFNITLSEEYIPSTTIFSSTTSIRSTSFFGSSVLAVTTKESSMFSSQSSAKLIASTAISQSKERFVPSTVLSTFSTSLSQVKRSSSHLYTVSSSDNFGSSVTSSAKLVPSTTPQSYTDSKSSSDSLLSGSSLLSFTSMKSSKIKTIASTKSLTSASSIISSIPLSTSASETEWLQFSTSFSKIPSLSKTVSSTGSIISSTTSHIQISRSAKRFTQRLSSTSNIILGSTKLSKVPSSVHSIVPPSSLSSFVPYSNTLMTATFLYVSYSSSSTVIPSSSNVGEEFRVQVILLIPLYTQLSNTFKEKLRRNLERLYELGLNKATSSRKRRGINEIISPLSYSGRNSNLRQLINEDLDTSKGDRNERFRRQTKNNTRVQVEVRISVRDVQAANKF